MAGAAANAIVKLINTQCEARENLMGISRPLAGRASCADLAGRTLFAAADVFVSTCAVARMSHRLRRGKVVAVEAEGDVVRALGAGDFGKGMCIEHQ